MERIKKEREEQYHKQLEEWKKACEQAKTEGIKKPTRPKKPKNLALLTEEELAKLPRLPNEWCFCLLSHLGDLSRGKSNTSFLNFNSYFPDSIVGFMGNKSLVNNFYVYYFIQATRKKIEAFAPATAQKNINLKTLERLIIPYCSLKEQQELVSIFESRLSVCDQLEQSIEDSLKKTESLRQSILQKAFSGELTKEWQDEHPELISGENSAENLLERIKAEKQNINAKYARKI